MYGDDVGRWWCTYMYGDDGGVHICMAMMLLYISVWR